MTCDSSSVGATSRTNSCCQQPRCSRATRPLRYPAWNFVGFSVNPKVLACARRWGGPSGQTARKLDVETQLGVRLFSAQPDCHFLRRCCRHVRSAGSGLADTGHALMSALARCHFLPRSLTPLTDGPRDQRSGPRLGATLSARARRSDCLAKND